MIKFVKFFCRGCDKVGCEIKPEGSWCSETEGCVKEVSSLNGNKYYHLLAEVMPAWRQGLLWNEFEEWDAFLEEIHEAPPMERFKR